MNKKDFFVIVGIVLATIIIAILINWLLSIDGFIPSAFSKSEWFGFWTTYTTGVFALVVGYLAISFGNKNSERALQQQNKLLQRQASDKIKQEISNEIKAQNRLFNIFDHSVALVSINHNDIPSMNEKVAKDRASVKERCIEWSFVKQMYLASPYLMTIVDEYDKCWEESVRILENYLMLQINLLLKIQDVNRAIYSKGLYDRQSQLLTQQLELSAPKDKEKLKGEIEEAEKGSEQQKRIQMSGNKEIADIIKQLKALTDGIISAQNTLATASVCFLTKLNGFVFLTPDDLRTDDIRHGVRI